MLIFPDFYSWVENNNRQKPWEGFILSGDFAAGTQTGLFSYVLFLKQSSRAGWNYDIKNQKVTLFFPQIKPCGAELAPGDEGLASVQELDTLQLLRLHLILYYSLVRTL